MNSASSDAPKDRAGLWRAQLATVARRVLTDLGIGAAHRIVDTMTTTTMQRYFAYGSNLWWPRLKARAPSAECIQAGALSGFELHFRKIGADGSAKADLHFTGQLTHRVYGVVYAVSQSDMRGLDRIEGGYRRASVCIEGEQGALWALTYVASQPAARPFEPFDWYRELIVAGGRAHRLPRHYLERLAVVTAVVDPNPGRRAGNWPHPRAGEH